MFINQGCFFLDYGGIRIGDRVLIGPRVTLSTAGHPVELDERYDFITHAPIVIEDDVWIGAAATITPVAGDGGAVPSGGVGPRTVTVPHRVCAMKPKELSFSIFGLGARWEFGTTNKDIARRTIRFLEDRRLLFGPRGVDPHDLHYCVKSAQEIRQFLGDQLQQHDPGPKLLRALQEMRAACRRFLDAAAESGGTGQLGGRRFLVAVGELRSTFGFYVAALADRYDLEVDEDLRAIMPPVPEDASGEPTDLATLLDSAGEPDRPGRP
ncbi:DUF6650 family protein [Micromonospora endophytica]|uniref:DUF6650 family protein n=1 Tax=Micromonospora endophytica TaxID=515350 RepID=UPI0015E8CD1A|nr:DUF6650 family protein [Micromonospora endophytica]